MTCFKNKMLVQDTIILLLAWELLEDFFFLSFFFLFHLGFNMGFRIVTAIGSIVSPLKKLCLSLNTQFIQYRVFRLGFHPIYLDFPGGSDGKAALNAVQKAWV